MNKTNTYSFLLTTMLSGISQTALGNLNGDLQLGDDLSAISSNVDFSGKLDPFTNYSYNEDPESYSSISFTDAVNIEVLMNFAKTLTENITGVDPEIQQIVDEHFWEML